MRRTLLAAFVTYVALADAAFLRAQGADFSGSWILDSERSGPETQGISPQVSFPTELVIKQDAGELRLQTSTTRQDTHAFAYKLDGTQATTKLPDGTIVTGRVAWNGLNLVMTSKRTFTSELLGEFITDYAEEYSVAGGVLTVRRTQVAGGVELKGTAVYTKGSL